LGTDEIGKKKAGRSSSAASPLILSVHLSKQFR
jgi:hypothetical protein